MNDTPTRNPVLRFAPSPNGLLHLGHAWSALVNLRMAHELGATMLLRIEDIDTQRCTPALEAKMLQDLEWIGFEWDGEPLRQTERFDLYREVIDGLLHRGLLYPATLSRSQIRHEVARRLEQGEVWPVDPDGVPHYPGSERELPKQARIDLARDREDCILRLDTREAIEVASPIEGWFETGAGPDGETGLIKADPEQWGDVIIGRKSLPASYHLSCVVDDAEQGVTHVVRGRDLFHATSMHRLLQELLGLAAPAYHHHDLILGEDGRKLSKSAGDTAIRHLREAGMTPGDVRRMIGLGS